MHQPGSARQGLVTIRENNARFDECKKMHSELIIELSK